MWELTKEEVTLIGVNQAMLDKEANIYYASFKCIASVGGKKGITQTKDYISMYLQD